MISLSFKSFSSYILISCIACIPLILFLILPWQFSQNLFIHHGPGSIPLSKDQSIVQTFEPEYPLKALNLQFKSTNDNDHDITILLGKSDGTPENAHYNYQVITKARSIIPQKWQLFSIPVTLPAHHYLALKLSSGSDATRASISPVISSLNTYPNGIAFLEQDYELELNYKEVGDILFQPVYLMNGVQIIKYYTNRIAFGKPIPKIIVAGVILGWVWILSVFIMLMFKHIVKQKTWKYLFVIIITALAITAVLYYHPHTNFTFEPI